MLTITDALVENLDNTAVLPCDTDSQLSDAEIMRRVEKIRAQWSDSERIERRQTAEDRFAGLIDALGLDKAA